MKSLFADSKRIAFEEGLKAGSIAWIPDEVYTAFVEEVKKQSVVGDAEINKDVAIVYSPLNGAGLRKSTRTWPSCTRR